MNPSNILRQDPREYNFAQNPYSLYKQLHRTGLPVYWENYGFWCLSSFESVNAALKDKRFARKPPNGITSTPLPPHLSNFAASEEFSLLALEPPDHTRLRKYVNQAFVNRQVNLMAEGIQSLADYCLDRVSEKGQFELLSEYATPIPVTVITRLLGVPESTGEQLIRWSHDMVKVYTLTQTYEEELRADRAAAEFQEFLQGILEEKKRAPSDDLISNLIEQQTYSALLSDEEIICVVILLLNAGHEATVHQLGNAVLTLLTHYQGDRRKELLALLANDSTADAVVLECLRFDAPLHLFTRYAQKDIQLTADVLIPAGDQVGLLLAAANRCPRRFKQADCFDPERKDAGHLSLGAGIHFCVGAHLARLELRIALQALFKRFPTLSLKDEACYQNSFHFHGLEALSVTW